MVRVDDSLETEQLAKRDRERRLYSQLVDAAAVFHEQSGAVVTVFQDQDSELRYRLTAYCAVDSGKFIKNTRWQNFLLRHGLCHEEGCDLPHVELAEVDWRTIRVECPACFEFAIKLAAKLEQEFQVEWTVKKDYRRSSW